MSNQCVALSLDDRPFDWASFEKLGERIQEVIKKAPEYDRAVNDLPAQDEPPLPTEGAYGGLPDDDIPF